MITNLQDLYQKERKKETIIINWLKNIMNKKKMKE
jgi:hypothetical protein